jgi:hypothetical protein
MRCEPPASLRVRLERGPILHRLEDLWYGCHVSLMALASDTPPRTVRSRSARAAARCR